MERNKGKKEGERMMVSRDSEVVRKNEACVGGKNERKRMMGKGYGEARKGKQEWKEGSET